MWKWILVGALVLLYVPAFVILALPGDMASRVPLHWLVPAQDLQQAKTLAEAVRVRKYALIEKAIDPQYVTPDIPKLLAKMSDLFPAGNPKSVYLLGSNWKMMKGEKTTDLTLAYDYDSGTESQVIVEVTSRTANGKTVLTGLHVLPQDEAAIRARTFAFAGKGPGHYLVAGTAVFLFVFTLVSVFYCMKTPIPRFKWAWVIFVLLGFVTLQYNWATGASNIQLFSLQVCSVAFIKMGLSPVILKLSIPLGAIMFWSRRHKWLTEAALRESDLRNAPAPQIT